MKARHAFALVALMLLLVAFAIALHRPPPPPEPTFAGRTLTQLAMLNPNAIDNNPRSLEAREAIRAIGTNALPTLLAWLTANPEGNPLRQAAKWLLSNLPNTAPFRSARNWAISDQAELHFEIAAYLFPTLGPVAAPAIPDLERLASDSRGQWSAYAATHSLAGIGPQALPALQRIAVNPSCPTRNVAASQVKEILAQSGSGPSVAH